MVERTANSYSAWLCSLLLAFHSLSLAIIRCDSNWAIKAAPTLSCHYTNNSRHSLIISRRPTTKHGIFLNYAFSFLAVSGHLSQCMMMQMHHDQFWSILIKKIALHFNFV